MCAVEVMFMFTYRVVTVVMNRYESHVGCVANPPSGQ